MDSKKLIFGLVILTFILIEVNAGKSHRRFKNKDNDDADTLSNVDGQDLSLNSTHFGDMEGKDGEMVLGSSLVSNTTDAIGSTNSGKKHHRSKHRRQHHKRKHSKRIRKNKRRDEKETENQDQELAVAGFTGGEISELSRDPKQLSVLPRRRNHQIGHQRRSDKHHQRQLRRLHRRKKIRSQKKLRDEHKDEPSPTDP